MLDQLNQAGVIFFMWVFCLLEDKWFDKILIYQIKGQAEKLGVSANNAESFYYKSRNKWIWTILALALTVFILSTYISYMSIKIVFIMSTMVLCAIYISLKLNDYNKSSFLLNKN